ncbi:MAG: tyrosinase family protein [Actinomycetota bacterium]|nr:tyrosinase family protein [Actinomycetota bacterium]
MAVRERKNAAEMTNGEWSSFIRAIDGTHGTGAARPTYREFVRVHVDAMTTAEGMAWGVHSMSQHNMVGRNFFAWHRLFLVRFENRLRQEEADVTLPYWNWRDDPAPPAAVSRPRLLERWSVDRSFDEDFMPTSAELDAVMERNRFKGFQYRLEMLHGSVHVAVGGTMETASSPADPLFWLHHANIDRLWARWQSQHRGQKPSNSDETLRPRPLFRKKVREVLSIRNLGYRYAGPG